MQKVFKNCYALDENCYENYGLSEEYLMHHAALGMAEYIRSNFSKGTSVLIVSGPGNNGADGVALAREILHEYSVKLFMPYGAKSHMAKFQVEKAVDSGVNFVESIDNADVIVDAIFGAGFNRELDADLLTLLNNLNNMNSFKIACDVPTGIGESFTNNICFNSDITITMGALKESLYDDKNLDIVGKVLKADLGLDSNKYELETDTYLLNTSDMKLPTRYHKSSHKGDFGHTAIISGNKSGASIMAAMAATKFGSGLTTIVNIEDENCMQEYIPPYLMTSHNIPQNTTAIAIGMGLGKDFNKEFLKDIFNSDISLVIDADLFYVDELLDLLNNSKKDIVLTPHPKEFASLWSKIKQQNISVDDVQNNRFNFAKEFTSIFPNITLILKGANMIIANSNSLYINEYGTSKLSKGGSGDVLSGLIAALLAQGYNSLDASISATLAFTTSALEYKGASYSMLPTDIIDGLSTLEHKF